MGWRSRLALAFEHRDQMRLEAPLRDVHPVGQEIPHHVPKLQIGQWADIACARLKAGVILVIKPVIKGRYCIPKMGICCMNQIVASGQISVSR